MCFKGMKDGWLSGCRKVIGIDGCFITHVCKGELLTAMGRDANNQMYPITWAIVDVENTNNWCWFLSLLVDGLQLEEGLGLTIISDSHMGLIEAVKTWLPQAEHRHCTRHLYANFKKKCTGLHYKRLFWGEATSTIEQDFTSKMREIRAMDKGAYAFLMERDPTTWCQAYFQTATSYASFENGILKSFNAQILSARASACDDIITPSIRNHLEVLKDKQRKWTIFPSGYQVVKVGKRDEAYGVNLLNPDIRSTINTPPLPPIIKTMPGRLRKNRIKHPSELDNQHHETDIPPRPQKSCVYTTSKNKRGGISINDVFKTQKEVGESSKRGRGTVSKRGKGYARGSRTIGSGTASNRGRGCARSFGTMGRGTARKRGRGYARGSGTIGRGSGTMGRGSTKGSATVGRGFTRGGHVGSTAMGSHSKRGGTAKKGFDDRNNTEVMDEEERLHAENEQRLDSEREHNGRIYQDWDQVSQDELVKGPTLSILEAVDEAIQEHNDGLPLISEGQFHSLNQASGNSEHPISQPAPTLLETTTEESHTPRAPRPRLQIMPRGK
ncbi:hypothetical protein Tco_0237841 [Tanacetum coccineum]